MTTINEALEQIKADLAAAKAKSAEYEAQDNALIAQIDAIKRSNPQGYADDPAYRRLKLEERNLSSTWGKAQDLVQQLETRLTSAQGAVDAGRGDQPAPVAATTAQTTTDPAAYDTKYETPPPVVSEPDVGPQPEQPAGPPIQAPPTVPNSQVPGVAYDDDGNLLPGWTLDENNNPVFVGGDFVEPATLASAAATRAEVIEARKQATKNQNAPVYADWRVRLRLADKSDYLYNASNPGILQPLKDTNGIVFPYTPQIQVNYVANYDPTELVHSNYKFYQYRSSAVDSITITCDFTSQDTSEANYVMAVIHFLRSATKMFYGQDSGPIRGTPPPLCYLTGLGTFQFDKHPLAITGFNYNLPNQVDYIRADPTPVVVPGPNTSANQGKDPSNMDASVNRMNSSFAPRNIVAGAVNGDPKFATPGYNTGKGLTNPTYVPTLIQIQITALPIITRNDISNNFSVREYATGKLLQGSKRQGGGGGIW